MPILTGRYVVFGHSMGAYIAYEFALEIERRHLPLPTMVCLSSAAPPAKGAERQPLSDLPDDELISELIRMGGFVVAETPELLELMLPTLRSDLLMTSGYRALRRTASLTVPILATCGSDEAQLVDGDLQAWRKYTTSVFSTHVLPGGHFYLVGCVQELATLLSSALRGGR